MADLRGVREGMKVVDATGEEVGRVRRMKMGDPQAASAEGQDVGDPQGPVNVLLDAVLRPDSGSALPEERADHLLRTGYVEIDRRGLLTGTLHVSADDVAEVDEADEVVRLSITPS